MKTKMKIPQEMSIIMRYLHQHGGMKISHIPMILKRSIYRHPKKEVNPRLMQERRKYNKGRPPKLNSRGERKTIGKYQDFPKIW